MKRGAAESPTGDRTPIVLAVHQGDPVPGAELVGGKAHNLARLAAAGAVVPRWIVLTADLFREHVLQAVPAPAGEEEISDWQASVRETRLPEEVRARLLHSLRSEGLDQRLLAVRSSAVAEDGAGASYAGQFDSLLGVPASELEAAIARVWSSAANTHAVAYGRGLTAMGVIVQEMVDAEVSGVAFGADPVSGDREVVVVSAVWGLGEGLVSGELDADTYRVRFNHGEPLISARLASKSDRVRLRSDGGSVQEPLPDALAGETPTLDDAAVAAIALETRRLGEALGTPQDVEWAMDAAKPPRLHILQARPITTLSTSAAGERRIWDNSNIVESYAGVTSPLTFSFARTVYEEVYRQFCGVVGVPAALIDEHRHVFANMLGLVQGRVYYNLLNWYRTLALLPGYSVNRAFMERMMGVREKLNDPPVLEATSGRGMDALRLAGMVARLVRESRGLARAVPAFHARVDRVLVPLSGEDLTAWDADRLLKLYRKLEEELLRNWQTPLVNDFFAMIWFGVLGRIVESWLPDAPATLANDLLVHEGGIISAEPAERVRELALLARNDPAVRAHFDAEADPVRLERRLATDPAAARFTREFDAYLARFGDRCMNELKLETLTLAEDPSFLFQTIRSYMAAGDPALRDRSEPPGAVLRARAEAQVRASLGRIRRRLFETVLTQTRARVRDRENLRFERTRVFGVVRRIFLGLGHHLVRAGRIEDARDIFLLRIEEIFGYVDGTSAGGDLGELVRLRREQWAGYDRAAAPPDRFESIGPVSDGRWIIPAGAAVDVATDDVLRGIGCCPGVVRAPVRLVREPKDAGALQGHILVAERTDPGWTLIFPSARGILVERGSLLSHSAIVAREMGIPCVVSIPGLMERLRDGDIVEMNGAAGTIRRVDG